MSWHRIWYVGNGGYEGDERYVELYDSDDEGDMAEQVREHLGSLPGGARSINWEKVKFLPDEVLDEKIKDQQWIIEHGVERARKKIVELEKLRKPKETHA